MVTIFFTPLSSFSISSIEIHFWGLMASLGIIIGLVFLWLTTKKYKIKFDHLLNITLLVVVLGFIGARLLYVILENNSFTSPWQILSLWDGGLALYGGLVLAIFGGIIYCKKNKIKVLEASDIFTPAAVLGIAIARIGCLLVHDHLGKLSDLPWSINADGISRHPVSGYYLLSLIVLFIILLFLGKKYSQKVGFITFFALSWYSGFRFLIDFFRDFEGRTEVFVINQIFLGVVFIISLYFLLRKK